MTVIGPRTVGHSRLNFRDREKCVRVYFWGANRMPCVLAHVRHFSCAQRRVVIFQIASYLKYKVGRTLCTEPYKRTFPLGSWGYHADRFSIVATLYLQFAP